MGLITRNTTEKQTKKQTKEKQTGTQKIIFICISAYLLLSFILTSTGFFVGDLSLLDVN